MRALVFSLLLGLAGAPAPFAASTAGLIPVPQLTGRVVDLTGTLSSGDIGSLEAQLAAFEARKGSQVAVLIVPTTLPEAIEQYSIRVADAWKVGRAKTDDGAILLVAKDDRALRLEVGYGLEGALTDAMSKRIISDIITPRFREGDFSGGVAAGVQAILKVIDGEPLPAPTGRPQMPFGRDLSKFFGGFAIAGFMLSRFLGFTFGRVRGGMASGGLLGAAAGVLGQSLILGLGAGLLGFLVTLIIGGVNGLGSGGYANSRRRGPFDGFGGGFGGGGGWGGGSGGGFSGGGGGFGGGGASGRW